MAEDKAFEQAAEVEKIIDRHEKEHLFVVNPRSFPHKSDMDAFVSRVGRVFKDAGLWAYHIHVSRYPRDAIGVVHKYIQGLPQGQPIRVYAVGGDGILFDCLNAVMGVEGAELAAIPYGRENDFVRAFGDKKEELFRDIAAQIAAPSVPTDVIRCDDNYALNFCVVGLETMAIMWKIELSKRFSRARDFIPWFGSAAYYLSTAFASFNARIRSQEYQITVDGEVVNGNYVTIHISNGPCYGKTLAPVGEAVPDDGFLDLVLGRAQTIAGVLMVMLNYVRGRRKKPRLRFPEKVSLAHRRVREVTIQSDRPLMVDLDGEAFFDTAIAVRVVPGGVRFVAPHEARFVQRVPYDGGLGGGVGIRENGVNGDVVNENGADASSGGKGAGE
ncbi:MAG: hypothetical protein LBU58_12360 [Clostridiales bacterium]|jgi:diacylglycerol kinase family enzyme|nr:hypothetical protein [Clostridiales bacterium]